MNEASKKELRKVSSWEIRYIIFLALAFILVNIRDLNSWYYSIIGDEYAFYEYAIKFEDYIPDLFRQDGVYGYHPRLSSYYQYLVMKVFGMNNFGWRLSSVFIPVFSLPALYFLVKNLFEKKTAIFTAAVFCSSFYFFAYAHLGYNNIQAILPLVYSLWLLTEAEKNRNNLLYTLSGVAAGVGWYTFFTARIVIILVLSYLSLTFILSKKNEKNWQKTIWLVLGFSLTTLPLFVSSSWNVISQMKEQSMLNPEYLGVYYNNPIKDWVQSFIVNFTAFFSGQKKHHFLEAPLSDPISQMFVVLGFITLVTQKNKNTLFLVIAYVLSIAMVAFRPVPEVGISRLQISMVFLTMIAGVGWQSFEMWTKKKIKSASRSIHLILLILIFVVNFEIFFRIIPKQYPVTKESLVVKAIQDNSDITVVYEGEKQNSTFRNVIEAYGLKEKVKFINEEDKSLPIEPYVFINNEPSNKKGTIDLSSEFISKCSSTRLLKTIDRTEKNWIESVYCGFL